MKTLDIAKFHTTPHGSFDSLKVAATAVNSIAGAAASIAPFVIVSMPNVKAPRAFAGLRSALGARDRRGVS